MDRFEAWRKVLEAKPLVVIGLMSGTSADGVDGAVLRFEEGKAPEMLFGLSHSYPEKLRRELLRAPDIGLDCLASLHISVARAFAETAEACVSKARSLGVQVSLVASHGQTVFHHSGEGPSVSIQIGEADQIARAVGLPVVFDFRAADIAGGGEGAPLVPAGDLDLFGHRERPLAILNLGGIANLTILGPGKEDCMAWDVGPANCLSDALCRKLNPQGPGFDLDGRLAARGEPSEELIQVLLSQPFFQRMPPKSTGRETFGEGFLETILSRFPNLPSQDVLASFALLVGRTVARDLGQLPRSWQPRSLLVAGGGLRNKALMAALRGALETPSPPVPSSRSLQVESSGASGVDPRYREAACFAALGRRALLGLPGSFPSTTGVQTPTILGKWAFPQP
jgi:anhydro-N-acetylmuramic acid kinase